MGKARILSAEGQGLYTIEILEDRTRAESRKALAQQRITEIDSELTDLEQALTDAQQAVDDGAAAQDQAIATYQADPTDEHRKAMEEQAAKLIKLAEARDAVRSQIASLNLERLTLQATIDRVDTLPPLRQQDAWCADLTEDLSGEVGTAEVPGEVGQVLIKPGFSGNTWSAADDGAIQPALSSTPAGVFYNLAMMPGWQKWRPTFRIATISNINNDLCDITLDAATSSQQGLNVNAASAYSGVPIMYMDCNGDAFEEGDRVLVAFSGNTDQPMVVGFEQNPRPCYHPRLVMAIYYESKMYPEDPGIYQQHIDDLLGAYGTRIDRGEVVVALVRTQDPGVETMQPIPAFVIYVDNQTLPPRFWSSSDPTASLITCYNDIKTASEIEANYGGFRSVHCIIYEPQEVNVLLPAGFPQHLFSDGVERVNSVWTNLTEGNSPGYFQPWIRQSMLALDDSPSLNLHEYTPEE